MNHSISVLLILTWFIHNLVHAGCVNSCSRDAFDVESPGSTSPNSYEDVISSPEPYHPQRGIIRLGGPEAFHNAIDTQACANHVLGVRQLAPHQGEITSAQCLGSDQHAVQMKVWLKEERPYHALGRPFQWYQVFCKCPPNSECLMNGNHAHCVDQRSPVAIPDITHTIEKNEERHQGSVDVALLTRQDLRAQVRATQKEAWSLTLCKQLDPQTKRPTNGAGHTPGKENNFVTVGIKDENHPHKLYSDFSTFGLGAFKLRKVDWNKARMTCVVTGGYAVTLVMKIHYFSVPLGSRLTSAEASLHVKRILRDYYPESLARDVTMTWSNSKETDFHGVLQ